MTRRSPRTLALGFAVLVSVFSVTMDSGTADLALGGAVLTSLAVGALSLRRNLGRSPLSRLVLGAAIMAFSAGVTELQMMFSSGIEALPLGDICAIVGYLILLVAARETLQDRTLAFQWEPFLDATLSASWLAFLVSMTVLEPSVGSGSSLSGAHAKTVVFMVLALAVAWYGLRLCLGGATRSRSFEGFVAALFLAATSELLFQAQLGGTDSPARRIAPVLGAVGLITLVGAVTSRDADRLLQPSRSDRGANRVEAIGGAAVTVGGLLATISFDLDIGWIALICLTVAGAVVGARLVLLLRSQQRWIDVNTMLRAVVEQLMNEDDADQLVLDAEAAAQDLLGGHDFAAVTFELDPAITKGSENAVLNEAWGSMKTAKSEVQFDGPGVRRTFSSQLAVPATAGQTQVVLAVEAVPVLAQDEVTHLEMLASSVAIALEAQALRETSHSRRSNDRFRALVQDSNDVIALVNRETLLIEFVSPTLSRLLGYSVDQALGRSPLATLHPEDRAAMERRLESPLHPVAIEPTDVRVQHNDGKYLWFSLSVRDLAEESEVSGLLFSYADIHDRKMTELQMVAAETRYRTLVTNSNDVMLLMDDGIITYLTPNVERVFNYRAADLIGARADVFLDERGDYEVERLFDDNGLIRSGSDTVVQLSTADGRARWAQLTFLDPGLPGGEVMVSIRDVTEQRRLEASLREQAIHDPLTGLFNRASVYHELQKTLQRLERNMHLAVLHLDVQDFKAINDSLGFAAGDALLVDIATRLRTVLRRSDTLARFNGDEFAIVTLGSSAGHLEKLIERLRTAFDEPFDIAGRQVPVTVAIGAALAKDNSENATRLLESAGIALQHAKSAKQDLAVFEDQMREAASERFELASGLLDGIERDEFFVVYQPILSMGAQKVSSTEALLRWHHPERGFVSPGTFIPLAEQSGAIVQLGRWVLQRACDQLVDWHQHLPDGRGLSMSVNVSARQLEVEGEAEQLLEIIAASGVDTTSLILELTESVMLEDARSLRAVLDRFRALGIRVAVDDFGTGAAGLGHLRDVPFDILKIDKSYIDGLGESDESQLLIARVIELAHGLNARIVAEGIETPLQAGMLRSMQCDYGQGFYLGHPMESAQILDWFARGRAGSAAASIAAPTDKAVVVTRRSGLGTDTSTR